MAPETPSKEEGEHNETAPVRSITAQHEEGKIRFSMDQTPEGLKAFMRRAWPVNESSDIQEAMFTSLKATQVRSLLREIHRDSTLSAASGPALSCSTFAQGEDFAQALADSRELLEAFNKEARRTIKLTSALIDAHQKRLEEEAQAITTYRALSDRFKSKRRDPQTAPLDASWLDETIIAGAYGLRLMEEQLTNVADYIAYVNLQLSVSQEYFDATEPPHRLLTQAAKVLRSTLAACGYKGLDTDDGLGCPRDDERAEWDDYDRKAAIYASLDGNRRLLAKRLATVEDSNQEDESEEAEDWALRDCSILKQAVDLSRNLEDLCFSLLSTAAAHGAQITNRLTVLDQEAKARKKAVMRTDRGLSDVILGHFAHALRQSARWVGRDETAETLVEQLQSEEEYGKLMRSPNLKVSDKVKAAEKLVSQFITRRSAQVGEVLREEKTVRQALTLSAALRQKQVHEEDESDDDEVGTVFSFKTAHQTPRALSRRTTGTLSRQPTRQGSVPLGAWSAKWNDLASGDWKDAKTSKYAAYLKSRLAQCREQAKPSAGTPLTATRRKGARWIGQKSSFPQGKSTLFAQDRETMSLKPAPLPEVNVWEARKAKRQELDELIRIANTQKLVREQKDHEAVGEGLPHVTIHDDVASGIDSDAETTPLNGEYQSRPVDDESSSQGPAEPDLHTLLRKMILMNSSPSGVPALGDGETAQQGYIGMEHDSAESATNLAQGASAAQPFSHLALADLLVDMIYEAQHSLPYDMVIDAVTDLIRQDDSNLAGEWVTAGELKYRAHQQSRPEEWYSNSDKQVSTLFGKRIFELPDDARWQDDVAASSARRPLSKVPFRARAHSVIDRRDLEEQIRLTARDIELMADEERAREELAQREAILQAGYGEGVMVEEPGYMSHD